MEGEGGNEEMEKKQKYRTFFLVNKIPKNEAFVVAKIKPTFLSSCNGIFKLNIFLKLKEKN